MIAVVLGCRRGGAPAWRRCRGRGRARPVPALVGADRLAVGSTVDEFGFSAHKARWLWAIGAFLTAFVVVSWLRVGRLG